MFLCTASLMTSSHQQSSGMSSVSDGSNATDVWNQRVQAQLQALRKDDGGQLDISQGQALNQSNLESYQTSIFSDECSVVSYGNDNDETTTNNDQSVLESYQTSIFSDDCSVVSHGNDDHETATNNDQAVLESNQGSIISGSSSNGDHATTNNDDGSVLESNQCSIISGSSRVISNISNDQSVVESSPVSQVTSNKIQLTINIQQVHPMWCISRFPMFLFVQNNPVDLVPRGKVNQNTPVDLVLRGKVKYFQKLIHGFFDHDRHQLDDLATFRFPCYDKTNKKLSRRDWFVKLDRIPTFVGALYVLFEFLWDVVIGGVWEALWSWFHFRGGKLFLLSAGFSYVSQWLFGGGFGAYLIFSLTACWARRFDWEFIEFLLVVSIAELAYAFSDWWFGWSSVFSLTVVWVFANDSDEETGWPGDVLLVLLLPVAWAYAAFRWLFADLHWFIAKFAITCYATKELSDIVKVRTK